MDKKYCAYLCSGCGIGDALDMEALAEVVTGEMSMDCKTSECLCGSEGRALIEKDIAGDGVNSVVVGACSPRVMQNEFDFGEDKITVRANLREQVVWTEVKPAEGEEPHAEAAEFLMETAGDYMRMACTRAQKTELPEAFMLETMSRKILVMGGGIAGMTAAKEAAAAGYEVTLVEKEATLGGQAANWRKSFPTKSPWTDLEESPVEALVSVVQADARITVRTGTEVARIAGSPGDFRVSLKDTGSETEWDAPAKITAEDGDKIEKGEMENPNASLQDYMAADENAVLHGAVVLATGWVPADVSEYEHLGYGAIKNVVTNTEFEQMAKEGKVPASVAFIQSPGGKEHDMDFPYCNSVTSMVALKQAQYVCEDNEEGNAFILYQHMRTPGSQELYYKSAQQNNGIFMTKASVTKVEESGGKLKVIAEDTLLGEDLALEVDMVVLAAGMVPTTKDEDTINLAYRQGPAFSDLELFDGYADSHFICFPYETRRTGVYTCGGVRKAETIDETIDDATGAALKAIQCLESTDRGVSVHPRSGDATYPEFFMQRCTQCKRCTEECPFGALDDDEKGTPLPNNTRCRRCGTCMGACPERIIGFKDYNIDLIGSMIKAVEVPEEDDDRLRILIFVCENDAYPALDAAGLARIKHSKWIRFIPVRCLGSVNTVWIADALSSGFDGVILIGCKSGDDYQCHFMKGSELMETRSGNVQEKLKQLALEEERVQIVQLPINEFEKLPEIVNAFSDEIEEIGLNPFKGF